MNNMTLQTVDRALTVLEMLAIQPMSVQEIESKTGLNRTTVTRLIQTLANREYIEKVEQTNQFRIGMKVVEISSFRLNQVELKTEAIPFLRELSQKLSQVCHMGQLSHGEVVYIEKIEPIMTIRMYSAIGKRVPVHTTALGKMLASGLERTAVMDILEEKGMRRYTPHTIVDKQAYLAEIEKVRTQGFAADDSENEEGIYCFAAPILDYRGEMIAAISTSSIQKEKTTEADVDIVSAIKNTALQISKRMGYKGV